MAVTFGFYNSLAGDRVYDASDMSSMFDGIIRDGVFQSIGDAFFVSPAAGGGASLAVGVGRAWFNGTWTYNNDILLLTGVPSHATLDRIDMVVLEVNWAQDVRANEIKLIAGTPSSNPLNPTPQSSSTMRQYVLAFARMRAGGSVYLPQDINYRVGTGNTPFVTGPLSTLNVTNWLSQKDAEFQAWYSTLSELLTEEAATNLAAAIGVLQTNLSQTNDTIVVNQNQINTRVAAIENQIETLEVLDPGVGTRTQVFRGQSLGTSVSAAHMVNIRNGTFRNMWLGDYWTISGVKWRIVDFNYYRGRVSTESGLTNAIAERPHVVVMPDTAVELGSWGVGNDFFNTAKMINSKGQIVLVTLRNALGTNNLYLFRDYEQEAASTFRYVSTHVGVPSLSQITGSSNFKDTTFAADTYTYSDRQFRLMATNPEFRRCTPINGTGGDRYALKTHPNNTTARLTIQADGRAAGSSRYDAWRPYTCLS